MSLIHRHRTRGITLTGLVLAAALLGAAGIVGLRVLPTWLEYSAVRRAVDRAGSDSSRSIAEIQRSFDRAAAVEDITAITGRDLLIERGPSGGPAKISFRYERRVPLFAWVSLLIEYQGSNQAD